LVNFPRREAWLYRTGSGDSPVEAFLDSLTARQVQKVGWVLRLITDMGMVPTQYFKKLVGTDELWEVRVRSGGEAFRLLGFFDGPRRLVLTSGFAKKSSAVPRREIVRAEARKRDYISRKHKDERH
jgi:phage-related protein